jgi:hypothetical protein
MKVRDRGMRSLKAFIRSGKDILWSKKNNERLRFKTHSVILKLLDRLMSSF